MPTGHHDRAGLGQQPGGHLVGDLQGDIDIGERAEGVRPAGREVPGPVPGEESPAPPASGGGSTGSGAAARPSLQPGELLADVVVDRLVDETEDRLDAVLAA